MKKSKNISILAIIFAIVLVFLPLGGNAIFCAERLMAAETAQEDNSLDNLITAQSAYVVEPQTGKVIYSKNENEKLAPASMTKLMTLLVVLEEVEKGKISLNDKVRVSEYAASQEGSKCFLDAGSEYLVQDLIKSVMVASANDSIVALAEFAFSSEDLCVQKMNQKAKELELNNSSFKNVTGLDENGHYSSSKDMATIIYKLYDYINYLKSGKEWTYNMVHPSGRKTMLTNTNRLVRTEDNMVLSKTGFTDGAKYCLTSLSKKDDTIIVASVFGLNSSEKRFSENKLLLDYGLKNYVTEKVVSKSQTEKIELTSTSEKEAELMPLYEAYVTTKIGEENSVQTKVVLSQEKAMAPLEKGTEMGKIIVESDGMVIKEIPLVLTKDYPKSTYKQITKDIIKKF